MPRLVAGVHRAVDDGVALDAETRTRRAIQRGGGRPGHPYVVSLVVAAAPGPATHWAFLRLATAWSELDELHTDDDVEASVFEPPAARRDDWPERSLPASVVVTAWPGAIGRPETIELAPLDEVVRRRGRR